MVFTQIEEEQIEMVDLCLRTVKPLGANGQLMCSSRHFKYIVFMVIHCTVFNCILVPRVHNIERYIMNSYLYV